MQINNKEYNVLEDARNIINNLSYDLTVDYEGYLNDGNPPDEAFEKKLSTITRIEYELRKLLQDVDVVG
jgi:hypothetical protein